MTGPVTSSADRPISPAELAHVVPRFRKYRDSVQWWMGLLGAPIRLENPLIAFLTYDEEHHRLAVINAPNLPARAPQAAGVDYFDAEEAAAWFHSGAFRENPIDVEFDPNVLVERFRAGTPVAELVQQGSA